MDNWKSKESFWIYDAKVCKWILRKPIYWIIKRVYPEMLKH